MSHVFMDSDADGMTTEQERELAEWWRDAMDGDKTAMSTVARRMSYTTFTSTSNGAGRSPRPPRTVELAGYGGRHYQLGPEVRGDLDRMLESEILEGVAVPPEQSHYEFLLDELRRSA